MHKCIIFQYKGKYAHFLKAEANASALSYPFPSRTVLLGLAGAVLGLYKDAPQILLSDARFAVSGSFNGTHWHTAKLHQTYDAPLPIRVSRKSKGSGGSNKKQPKIIAQEWLFKPDFTVYAQLPDEYQDDFERRIKNREWHFSPSLGLSEMTAELNYINTFDIEALTEGIYDINTVVRKSQVELNMEKIIEANAVLKSIRMARDVSENRVFIHDTYLYEANGNSISVKTANVYKVGDKIVNWL